MNNEFGINNKIELYKRLVPALNSKINELEKNNIKNVKKEVIWNYLVKYKWQNMNNLTLYEMVDDILNADNNELIKNINLMIQNQNDNK